MLTSRVHESIDANAEAVLDFLEKAARFLYLDCPSSRQPEAAAGSTSFCVERVGSVISVRENSGISGQRGAEMIRFEVVQHTKTEARVDGFHAADNQDFTLMFYRIWLRLAIAFSARSAGETLRKVQELEGSGG